jgi:C_GCAxxG_C_C family probable redox protein
MLAVGRHYLGELTDREIQMTTGFAGGIGVSYKYNCGVFSAGVMIIGGLYGRISADQDEQVCQDLVCQFQEKFQERFETLNCGKLREEKYGSGGAEPCSILVERAARVLIDLLDAQEGENSSRIKG